MPPYTTHLATSAKRTGNNYQPMHDWLDNHPEQKIARHDLETLAENRDYVRTAWGEEAVSEFFLHVVEDLLMKEITTLKEAGCQEEAVLHSIEVARKALEIASRVKIPVDKKLVARGAVFHDLGKAKTYGMEHGEIGAKMAAELGLEQEIQDIILKHIRGGLTEPEAIELGLPVRDYTLKTVEEKIIIYADRMVDIYIDGIVPDANEKMAEERFVEILQGYQKYGKNKTTLQRYVALDKEIQGWMK
ncbi:HDIG domain-containing protein [Desulfopila sp. IMCC35006]|uniref:HDIG domain-containing metalloprotein n=1 Tax=Desulfopila sp. IMCC35006 TaxID=2569542 RepID=UPI0010ABABF9|nr:HDIG domain-containing metalloprotein [Desulfopila sp. IMCC35006]TKB23916.1 HDIG domain-containing protein [Desulfopila sp. IMCC35006]